MITVEFCPEGRPVSDFEVDDWLNDVVKMIHNKETATFKVSTNAPIYTAQVAVAEGKISKDNIKFIINEKTLRPNAFGSVNWVSLPENANEKILMAMMTYMAKKAEDDGIIYDGE